MDVCFNLEVANDDKDRGCLALMEADKGINGKIELDDDFLEIFFDANGALNAKALSDLFFPKTEAQVFISHSHKDEEIARKLAAWIENKLEISVFVDSLVWKSADKLLGAIDKRFCVSEKDDDGSILTYSYRARNLSTSHVHMMLNGALMEMISKCRVLIFLNTHNAIIDNVGIGGQYQTESPWIYSELLISKFLAKNRLVKEGRSYVEDSLLKVNYPANMSHMYPLRLKNLLNIWSQKLKGDKAIEILCGKSE